MIARYRQRYSEVQVDLTLAQRLPDLLDEGFDVSVVVDRHLPDSGLVSQRLGETFSVACASADYLERHGVPQRPQDLDAHACLGMVAPGFVWDEWTLVGPAGEEHFPVTQPSFRVNVAEALSAAIREGMGVGVLPLYTAIAGLRAGDFVRVMPEYRSHVMNIYALYPSRQYLDAKIRTWVDFMRESLPATIEADIETLQRYTRVT